MTRARASFIGLIATLMAMAGIMVAVQQDATGSTPPAYPYEQTVCWQMDAPDLTNPASYEWPQTKVDCSVVPPANTSACGDGAKYQIDTYWIRDDADRDYLAGMTTMSSSADDASLEPHGYYAVTVLPKPAGECATPTPTPTPTEPPVTETPTPTPTPTPTNPPRDCRENPVTCEPTPTKPPKPTPTPEIPDTTPPSRVCIDQNTIKVTHSDGTVSFVNDEGVCDGDEKPPAREEGF